MNLVSALINTAVGSMQAAVDRWVTDLQVPLGHQQAAHGKDLTQNLCLLPDLSLSVIPRALLVLVSSDEYVCSVVPDVM